MTPALRQRLLFGALGLSLAATAWVASREDEAPTAQPPRRAVTRTVSAPAPAGEWPAAVAARREVWPEADRQARMAWGEAPASPAPAPAATAPAADPEESLPSAPTFGYQLVGRLTDGQPRAILTNAQRSLVVGVGDVIDGQWRVDAVELAGLRVRPLAGQLPPQFIAFSAP